MKTFSLNNKVSSYILLLALGLLAVSCGSYHETSYYGNDGIYSRRGGEQMVETNQRTSYFADFPVYNVPEDNEPVGIFTDIDSYYGDEAYSTGYSGWGNSTNDVTVNVYGGGWYGGGLGWYGGWGWRNPYWGMGWGWNSWGWNSWHNPYWGWGGGYGWGWNSWHNPYWGWGGGYYPYYNNVAYYGGTRGGYYASDYAYRNRSFANTNNVRSNPRAYEVRGRNDNATRSNSRFTNNNSSRSTTLGTSRSSTLNNNRNSTINNSRNNTINNSRNNTINNSRNNTINNSRNNTINNSRDNSMNNSRNNSNMNRSAPSMNRGSSSPSMNRGGNMGGGRSSGMGGGGGRSSGGGRR